MEEIEEVGAVPAEPELVPIAAADGEDKDGGRLEQTGEGDGEEEEESVEDLIEEVEREEIERDSDLSGMDGDMTASAGARDTGDSDQELDELLDGTLLL